MDGVFLVDKEKWVTSRDVVNEIIKKTENNKVGHTGTLDPIATGVLVICVGKATKLVNYLTASVISINDDNVTLRDSDNIIYTFGISDNGLNLGDTLKVSFDGELNKNKEIQRKEV